MSTTEEHVKCAEECERLAAACHSKANRETLLYVADCWRTFAQEAAAVPAPPAKATQGSDGLQDTACVQSGREVAAGE
jgi:hypothetical protein